LQPHALNALAIIGLIVITLTLTGHITLPLLMVCLIGYMAAQGFVNPNSAAWALSEQGKRLGVASALLGTLQFSCSATAGLIISSWQTTSPLPLTTTLAICACLAWCFGRRAKKPA
jgi:MFS transporter, DHA1 family, multidrug resistance protein